MGHQKVSVHQPQNGASTCTCIVKLSRYWMIGFGTTWKLGGWPIEGRTVYEAGAQIRKKHFTDVRPLLLLV